jgi:HK97 gp10 family phage protein
MGFELTGMQEMLSKIQAMGKNVAEVQEKALHAGCEIIQKEIRNRAPVGKGDADKRGYGHLRDHIVIDKMMIDSTGERYMYVGPSKGKGFKGNLIEFGTAQRTTKDRTEAKGKHRMSGRAAHNTGAIAAHPFVEPAFLSKKGEALEAIAEIMREAINDV